MNEFAAAWEAYRVRVEGALLARLPSVVAGVTQDLTQDLTQNLALSNSDSPTVSDLPSDMSPHTVELLPQCTCGHERLYQAMRYACLNGGKRFRAMLVYACGEVAGANAQQLDVPAAAVEMIHAYSLVHDDLPAMDDDDLRRGKPSCHVMYDQATAILAGDALQTLAFEILSTDPELAIPPQRRLRMVAKLADASGMAGMAGGQALDMGAGGGAAQCPQLADLQRIHEMKTAALIRAAAVLGGLTASDGEDELIDKLESYAASIGLAFQIVDDILDVVAADEDLGKRGGADKRMQKVTYVSLLGVDKAKSEAQKLLEHANESVAWLGEKARFLQQLAHFVVNRSC